MTLPDIDRLSLLSDQDIQALLGRFAQVGLTRQAVAPFAQLGEGLTDPQRRPLRLWHLRQEASPLRTLLRLFMFMDPVGHAQATQALGDATLLTRLRDVGLVVERDEGLVCPLLLNLVDDAWVFCDDLLLGTDAVMGAGVTTADLIQAAWPTHDVGRVLDLGCGAGTAALLLAERARELVATDINPRAITLGRFNARLGCTRPIDFRLGSFFEPVQEETFDLIVCQPPFVSRAENREQVTFLHGGARGDELSLSIIEGLFGHLAPGGRAVLYMDWPNCDGRAAAARVREHLHGANADLLVLASRPKSVDLPVAVYASMQHPRLGPPYEQEVLDQLDHFHRMGITSLTLLVVVLQKTDKTPFTHVVDTRPFTEVEPTGSQVQRLILAQNLLREGPSALQEARLVVPPGVTFLEDGPKSVRISLPDSRLIGATVCSIPAVRLVQTVDAAPSVSIAVEQLMREFRLQGEEGKSRILAGVRDALGNGLLEVPLP
jgi:methylase of polypeptide subunit release factors